MSSSRGKLLAAFGATALLGVSVPSPDEQAKAPPAPADVGDRLVSGGALDTDCADVGPDGSGHQFIVTCPGKAWSPDRRWAIVTTAGAESGAQLEDASGRMEDDLTVFSDAMPFVVFWSPRSDWFFVNHYLGSGQDRLRVFKIVNRAAIERSSVFASAAKIAVSRYPCLADHASVVASGWRWSSDGRRIAMVVYARPDACHVEGPSREWNPIGEWEVLWMIGDVETGRIDPASVRVRADGVGPMPTDGPYARL